MLQKPIGHFWRTVEGHGADPARHPESRILHPRGTSPHLAALLHHLSPSIRSGCSTQCQRRGAARVRGHHPGIANSSISPLHEIVKGKCADRSLLPTSRRRKWFRDPPPWGSNPRPRRTARRERPPTNGPTPKSRRQRMCRRRLGSTLAYGVTMKINSSSSSTCIG